MADFHMSYASAIYLFSSTPQAKTIHINLLHLIKSFMHHTGSGAVCFSIHIVLHPPTSVFQHFFFFLTHSYLTFLSSHTISSHIFGLLCILLLIHSYVPIPSSSCLMCDLSISPLSFVFSYSISLHQISFLLLSSLV